MKSSKTNNMLTINKNNKNKYVGVFIHIPFCLQNKSKNLSETINENESSGNAIYNNYLQALLSEIESSANTLKDLNVDTIYIGGGNAEYLQNGVVKSIMQTINKNFNVLPNSEISLEIYPNNYSEEVVLQWKTAGINRVSVVLQSNNKKLLNILNYKHTVKDFVSTIAKLKQADFANINTDILLGAPQQKLKDVKKVLALINKLQIPHISAYSFVHEDYEHLKNLAGNTLKLPSDKVNVKMYNMVYKYLTKRGFERYEVSNFCKSGFKCKHFYNCWQMQYYVGFGAGAHSYYQNIRYNNFADVISYVTALQKGKAVEHKEVLNKTELFEETIMFGLRTADGINLNDIKLVFGIDLLTTKKNVVNEFLKLGLITTQNNILKLTRLGYYAVNKIILELVF